MAGVAQRRDAGGGGAGARKRSAARSRRSQPHRRPPRPHRAQAPAPGRAVAQRAGARQSRGGPRRGRGRHLAHAERRLRIPRGGQLRIRRRGGEGHHRADVGRPARAGRVPAGGGAMGRIPIWPGVQRGGASRDVPPHRAFVLGGRGTLLGDAFRDWGGRRAALLHVEWRMPVPFIRLNAGPARTPGTITLAPYTAWGSAAEPIALTPWRATPGTRMTVGLAAEWLGVLRLEAGYGVQSRHLHIAFDITRDFWDIL